jgi:hypothetical protein
LKLEAFRLEELPGRGVPLAPDCIGPVCETLARSFQPGGLLRERCVLGLPTGTANASVEGHVRDHAKAAEWPFTVADGTHLAKLKPIGLTIRDLTVDGANNTGAETIGLEILYTLNVTLERLFFTHVLGAGLSAYVGYGMQARGFPTERCGTQAILHAFHIDNVPWPGTSLEARRRLPTQRRAGSHVHRGQHGLWVGGDYNVCTGISARQCQPRRPHHVRTGQRRRGRLGYHVGRGAADPGGRDSTSTRSAARCG